MNVQAKADVPAERFGFGENWRRFLRRIDDGRIDEAKASLRKMLEISGLKDIRFLDIGSGSGLFSLAARMLGARVRSFDFDPKSVVCTRGLKETYFPGDSAWTVEEGSVLDEGYMKSLGEFDVVYAWGVLHHTGNMAKALENAAIPVRPGGRLFLSIYNDQGTWSVLWRRIKRSYNRLPPPLRIPFALAVMAPVELASALKAVLTLRPMFYVRSWAGRRGARGMSRWHDLVDWVGGYPFEVAKPEEIFAFYRERGFSLLNLKTCGGGLGCNEFVFVRLPDA